MFAGEGRGRLREAALGCSLRKARQFFYSYFFASQSEPNGSTEGPVYGVVTNPKSPPVDQCLLPTLATREGEGHMEKMANMFGCQQMGLPSRKTICIQHVFVPWAAIECAAAGICLPVLGEGRSSIAAPTWPCCH